MFDGGVFVNSRDTREMYRVNRGAWAPGIWFELYMSHVGNSSKSRSNPPGAESRTGPGDSSSSVMYNQVYASDMLA